MGGRFFIKRVNNSSSNGRIILRQMGEFKSFFETYGLKKIINGYFLRSKYNDTGRKMATAVSGGGGLH